jgi:hypothetical protein
MCFFYFSEEIGGSLKSKELHKERPTRQRRSIEAIRIIEISEKDIMMV